MSDPSFSCRVLEWFENHGRKDLPWQSPQDPYRVWISEIMLQQTQVTTVLGYFERFMASFPNIETLAHAPLEAVLDHWAGLGYYARARNLHRTAHILVTDWNGRFPETVSDLETLPGIGRSTAGAILSLGLGKTAPILDGNVRRVLARHFAVEGWPGQSATNKTLWSLSESLTPTNRTAAYNQAMMDLGATVCTPKSARCDVCPLQATCIAHERSEEDAYPARKPSKAIPVRRTFFLILMNQETEVFLEARPASGIWGGLLSLPECKSRDDVENWCRDRLTEYRISAWLPEQRHTFSHFHLDFVSVLIHIEERDAWLVVHREQFFRTEEALRVPAPIRTLLDHIGSHPIEFTTRTESHD